MASNYENFDNTEASYRKNSLIQERVGLVSTHMYKQFLDYQKATVNTAEVFNETIENLATIIDSLKKSFSSRGVSAQNIYLEVDSAKTIVTINILWHKISLTTRCNYEPQALFRENKTPLFSGRIMAINGNYYEIMNGVDDRKEEMKRLLDNEVASLYIPADKMQNAVFKIKHLSNREFALNPQDAAREFILKVIEIICGGGVYHEEGSRKTFNI